MTHCWRLQPARTTGGAGGGLAPERNPFTSFIFSCSSFFLSAATRSGGGFWNWRNACTGAPLVPTPRGP